MSEPAAALAASALPPPARCLQQQLTACCRFPTLHKLRVYAADKDAAPDGERCNKFAKTMRGMTEGMLCMYCPHGICVAFTILTRHEGPRIAFELIMSRFSSAPALIVYDNVSRACPRVVRAPGCPSLPLVALVCRRAGCTRTA